MMSSFSESARTATRTYLRHESVVFLKTTEAFGGLSNMAGGFPLVVNGLRILTSEALYQACRFPHRPEVQRLIIEQASPMTAKMKSKPFRNDSRPDWDRVRVNVMRWCLRVKLAENWEKFSRLLLETGDRPIVEESRRDDYWGAKPIDQSTLVGSNVLGRLLMELREEVRAGSRETFLRIDSPTIPEFLLNGKAIEPISVGAIEPHAVADLDSESAGEKQASLFGFDTVRDAVPRDSAGTSAPRLPAYSAVRGSGVIWLGKIPSTWDVRRNGRLFSERKQTGFPDLPILEVSLKTGVRVRNFNSPERKQMMADREKYKRAKRGDLAYNMMRMWQGAVGLVPEDGLVSPAYVVARPHAGVVSRYYEYLFRTSAYLGEIDAYSRGIVKDRNRLYWESFKQISSPVPPTEEQAAIVRYLDHVDRRVRRLVRAKRELIALLTEQKQAIIHRAVTRGLDPNVPLKDSGVEWLGEVPEHWDVMLLGRALNGIGQGWSPVAAEGEIAFDQWAVLTLSSVKRGGFNPEAIKPVSESAKIPDGIEVNDGDLLLTRSNTRELVGDTCIVAGVRPKTVMCDLIYRLTPDARCFDSGFLMYQLLSRVGRRQIEQDARGSSGTMPKISQRHIRAWRVLSPPLNEQQRISPYIVAESKRLDTAMARANREIELLSEYRTRLIADVVTGKLDVREAAANIPAEIEEADLPDEGGDVEAPESSEDDSEAAEDGDDA